VTHRLITIPFSHFCEKARWALDRAHIPFEEEGHLPYFSRRATLAAGGGRTTPVLLLDDGRVIADSTDILRFAGLPLDGEAENFEQRCDEQLGPHARRLAYFHMLKDDETLVRLVDTAPVPRLERVIGRRSLWLFKIMLRRGLKITPQSAERSKGKVLAVFAEVEERLKAGRRYLFGDAFSGADLTFAALAAPIVMPDAYAKWLVPLADFGADGRALVIEMRQHVAGKFALRLMDEDRVV
jgi:glutathione S-transferase